MGDPTYVTDKDTLRHIVENSPREKSCVFVSFFLSEYAERLIIGKNKINAIEKDIESEEYISESLKEFILNILIPQMYGIAQEYNDPKDDTDGDTAKIVERNYATVKYLITIKPELYSKGIKNFASSSIVTPYAFMQFILNDPKYAEFSKEFNRLWNELNTSNSHGN